MANMLTYMLYIMSLFVLLLKLWTVTLIERKQADFLVFANIKRQYYEKCVYLDPILNKDRQ